MLEWLDVGIIMGIDMLTLLYRHVVSHCLDGVGVESVQFVVAIIGVVVRLVGTVNACVVAEDQIPALVLA